MAVAVNDYLRSHCGDVSDAVILATREAVEVERARWTLGGDPPFDLDELTVFVVAVRQRLTGEE